MKTVASSPFHKEEAGNSIASFLDYEGANLEEFIQYCLAHHPERITDVKENFKSVFAQRLELKLPEKGRFADSTKVIAKLEGNYDWFPLEHLSDGMMRALRILLQLASCREGDILVIDEPELHLHPGAARGLRNLIHDSDKKIQIICSTHSPIFLDPSCSEMIILHRTNEQPEVLKATNVDRALLALGSSGLDAILYDIVIWSEGPSDKEYLQKWLELFLKDPKIPVQSIGLQQFGGGKLEHIDPIVLKSIARKSIVVIDSDKTAVEKSLTTEKFMFKQRCDNAHVPCWILNRHSIENYIPAKVLRKVLHIEDETFTIASYEKTLEKLLTVDRSISKVQLAGSIVKILELNDFSEEHQFKEEIKTQLLDVINSLVST